MTSRDLKPEARSLKPRDLPRSSSPLSKASKVLEAALVVGRHWNDQDGVNAQYLDELARAVASYDEASKFEEICRKWERAEINRNEFTLEVSCLLETCPSKQRCDACDPSFGCFSDPTRCQKKERP